ncbi:LOW QUALITY PROTEIN: 1-acylglycerol-3-phosphate O-acyltransferase PNPLA3 [Sorex fumeus]|uniref:LOW QUALITY PROTEIN: 1-acylglycerol-3-phosphate O-acyltransferase PNPLA3 n=1 Tax=Sorex fumeus TaxID=62283 RepID=UPI0024AE0EDA|nr:LOW QUALITY PROTEIN: 1-acylglycerol-3-phosphate O-acyltransferase PNPLA3 [Sorex fumeus]
MYDPERGWSLSFSGCGFLGVYHVGVTRCLSERAPHLLRDARMFYGASAGALHCVTFLAGMPMDRVVYSILDMVRAARRRNLGTLHPAFHMSRFLRGQLQKNLPDNVHQLVSGRLAISLTRVADGQNVLVSDFHSKDEVVDALVCSCFIPFYCGIFPPSFRGERYMDGGASDNMPFSEAKTTITVSPFYGEQDICPKAKSTNFLFVDFTKLSFRVCAQNAFLLSAALFPPDLKVLAEICFQGYLDALRFLEEKGICDRPQPGLSLSSGNSAPGGPESPPPAVPGASPKPDPLLDHLQAPLLPWNESLESLVETLSPKLTMAMREALREPDGYLNRFRNLLPVKVLSYTTLPLESAIGVAQRLVTWLPDVLDDIQWLHWAASHVCSQVLTRLLPAARSETPPGGQEPPSTRRNPQGAAVLPTPHWTLMLALGTVQWGPKSRLPSARCSRPARPCWAAGSLRGWGATSAPRRVLRRRSEAPREVRPSVFSKGGWALPGGEVAVAVTCPCS